MKLMIKKYRKLRRLTQRELSEISGISQSYIALLESNNNYKSPTLATIMTFAKALEICPMLLLSNECCSCMVTKEENKIKCKSFLKEQLDERV